MSASRPYVDAPITDVPAATIVADRCAAEWQLPKPVLLRVGMNAIYRAGDAIIRVGKATGSAASSQRVARALADAGVAVVSPLEGAAADVAGLTVTGWSHLVAVDAPIAWREVGASVARVHELHPEDLPDDYPLPSPTAFPWWDFGALLDEVGPSIDDAALEGIRGAVAEGHWWRDAVTVDAVVCHGDVHPGNVVMTADGPVLIDFDLMCHAAPAWDHAMLTTYADRWGGPERAYRDFAAGAGRSLADDPLTRTIAQLRNVAATLMRVRAGLRNDDARAEAERRLRYWRGDPDAPTWAAQ